jgi:hypothetical protein
MPIRLASLPAAREYHGSAGCAFWEGYVVADEAAFHQFLGRAVTDRLHDVEANESFEEELQGLATTGVATVFVYRWSGWLPA